MTRDAIVGAFEGAFAPEPAGGCPEVPPCPPPCTPPSALAGGQLAVGGGRRYGAHVLPAFPLLG